MDDLDRVARGLTTLDRERITGWQGVAGAAYNVVSEDLCEMGILDAQWSLTPLGLALRERLTETGR